MPNQQKVPPWKNSDAKKILKKDLESGEIPLAAELMSWQDVYELYKDKPEFLLDPEMQRTFRERLKRLRDSVAESQESASYHYVCLLHDRQLHPKKMLNYRGEPRWDDGSEAKRLLRLDMDEGKHKTMRPQDLRLTRPEYMAYSRTVFRGKIDQEERSSKFHFQMSQRKMPRDRRGSS
jgi:hypothetical protein